MRPRRNLWGRVERLEQQAEPPKRPRIFIKYSDGWAVEGQDLTPAEFDERYPDGPGPGDFVLKMPGFRMGAV